MTTFASQQISFVCDGCGYVLSFMRDEEYPRTRNLDKFGLSGYCPYCGSTLQHAKRLDDTCAGIRLNINGEDVGKLLRGDPMIIDQIGENSEQS